MSITNLLARKLIHYQSERPLLSSFGKKRAERIISLINECYNKHGRVDIIDVGGTNKNLLENNSKGIFSFYFAKEYY